MKTLMKNNLKLFLKSRYLLFGNMVFFIAINIYLVEGILGLSVRKDALYYLKQSQVLSVVCFVFFVFIAYEYLMNRHGDVPGVLGFYGNYRLIL